MKRHLLLGLLIGITAGFVSCSSIQNIRDPESAPTPTIDDLINSFSSSDASERANAAQQAALYYDNPNKQVLLPYLIAALQESNCGWDCSRVRAMAAQSIRYLGIYDAQAIEILTSWLTEPGHSDEELIQSIQTLGSFSSHASDATPGLVRLMTEMPSSSPQYFQIRVASANTLSKIGDTDAIPYLISMILSSTEPEWVRKDTAIALARYGSSAACAVPYLIPMLDTSVVDLQISAAIVINQATANNFPNSRPENWDPDYLGSWQFETESTGEYSIVIAAKNWWQEEGNLKEWPTCNKGLAGENVLP